MNFAFPKGFPLLVHSGYKVLCGGKILVLGKHDSE